MEATVIRIGNAFGFSISEEIIKRFDMKVGSKIEIDLKQIAQTKSKARDGWDSAFALYALEGEDKMMLPDFLDSEISTLL